MYKCMYHVSRTSRDQKLVLGHVSVLNCLAVSWQICLLLQAGYSKCPHTSQLELNESPVIFALSAVFLFIQSQSLTLFRLTWSLHPPPSASCTLDDKCYLVPSSLATLV